jgi:hypothetical protein
MASLLADGFAITVAPATACAAQGGEGIRMSSQISAARQKSGSSEHLNSSDVPNGTSYPSKFVVRVPAGAGEKYLNS